MFGIPIFTGFMVFIFWPLVLVASLLWGHFAFKHEEENEWTR
ncbi:hypothetical protein [Oikeobacillus pervagus]|nr:hypothetical protein [Oikeobacillus pervagus]